MPWLLYPLASAALGLVGLFCGGVLGTACVRWYRISSFEGGSGYFVVVLALAGAAAGFVIGLVTMIATGPREGADYVKSMAGACGILAGLTAVIALVSWWCADIPPTLDGRTMTLQVELRLPAGATRPVDTGMGSYVTLQSVTGNRVRASSRAFLQCGQARFENGRWIVPGAVPLFTTRGMRGLEFEINGESVASFMASIPARPGREFLAWTAWLPVPPAPHPPWPEDRPSFRYRLQPDLPPPPGPTAEDVAAEHDAAEQARFDAVGEDAPMEFWLGFTEGGADEGRRRAALERIVSRTGWPEALGEAMRRDDTDTAVLAMRAVRQLSVHPEPLIREVAATGRAIAAQTRAGTGISAEDDPDYAWAADVSRRFSAWFDAALALRETSGADLTPQLADILEAARMRPDSHALRADVVRVASYYLHQWAGVAPLASDPPPR